MYCITVNYSIMVAFLIILVLFGLISAVLAIQVAGESSLCLKVKHWFGMTQPYSKSLLALRRFGAWKAMLGTASYVLLPLIFVFIAVLAFHAFLTDMLDCPMCSAFHINWILLYLIAGIPLGYAFLFAPLAIPSVYILNRIR